MKTTTREDYYNFNTTTFNIAQYLKGRETIYVTPEKFFIRPRKVESSLHVERDKIMFKLGTREVKTYGTLHRIRWEGLPDPPKNPYHPSEVKAYREYFNGVWGESVVGYDWMIDIDGNKKENGDQGSFDISKLWALTIHDWLEKNSVTHTMNFSGTNFHIRIPHDYICKVIDWRLFSPTKGLDHRVNKAYQLAKIVAEETDVPFGKGYGIDDSVYDSHRIAKTPFSVSDGRVCIPLTRGYLDGYDLEDYSVRKVCKYVRLNGYNPVFDHRADGLRTLLERVM